MKGAQPLEQWSVDAHYQEAETQTQALQNGLVVNTDMPLALSVGKTSKDTLQDGDKISKCNHVE